MLLKLYDKDKNFIASLRNKDARITKSQNGDIELSVQIAVSRGNEVPVIAALTDEEGTALTDESGNELMALTEMGYELLEEMYLRDDGQEYVVKETTSPDKGWIEVVAMLNLEDLEGHPFTDFTVSNLSLSSAMIAAVAGTGWLATVNYSQDKTRSFQLTNVDSLEVIEKIREAYIVETRFDTINKRVYVQERIGEDKGTYFIEGFNARSMSRKSDTNDFITRLIPIGNDDLRIAEVNGGKEYVENYQYSDKVKYGIWQDTNYDNAENLKADAIYRLNELSKPRVSYSVDVVDLAKMKSGYDILSYDIGDTVIIRSNSGRINDKQRIVKMVVYPDSPEKNTCELGSTVLSFDDYQKSLDAARVTVENVTNRSGIIVGQKVYLPNGTSEETGQKVYISLPGKFDEVEVATQSAIDSASRAHEAANEAQESADRAQESADSAGQAALEAWEHADDAANAAAAAWTHADEAGAAATDAWNHADDALAAAATAQDSADHAQDSATQANTHANSALSQLGVVEQVLETLNWITEHGTYTLTQDININPNKVYFTYVGGVYVPVGEPVIEDIGMYYELTIDEAMSQYVASHLALTDAGLYIMKDDSAYKVLVSNNSVQIQDVTGRTVATFGESVVLNSSRPQYIGGNNAYIKYYDSDGDGIPDALTICATSITFADGASLNDFMDLDMQWEPEIRYASSPSGSSGAMTDARILKAHVYHVGEEITDQIDDSFFEWYWVRESDTGRTNVLIGEGKQLEIDAEDAGYSADILGRFYPERDDIPLMDSDGNVLTDENGAELLIYAACM
jgi:phage minor structural protein